jgi:BirA family biotin operon repressor/biotin-[acetyl-CoA-carboxylase] ligase
MQAEVDRIKMMIIGVGINVNHESFPDEIAGRATSLRLASGRPQSRIEILVDFLEEFESLYLTFEQRGPRAIIDQWTRLSSFANGRKIQINDGVRTIAGVTRGLNPLGALRVEQADGRTEEVYSGDVVSWE